MCVSIYVVDVYLSNKKNAFYYRSFDFEIELKLGSVHTFSSIEKGEYDKLFNYISSKKLHVKNTGKNVSFNQRFFKDNHNPAVLAFLYYF